MPSNDTTHPAVILSTAKNLVRGNETLRSAQGDKPDVQLQTLLEVKDLRISFPLDEGTVKAVDGIDLAIERGGVLGLVGESGCGKSVTAQSILRIVPRPGRIDSGQILLHRHTAADSPAKVIDIARLNPTGKEIRSIRGKDISMIFQEPMSSFSPLHTIGSHISEAILEHQSISRQEARTLAIELLSKVGIPNAARRFEQYPHELSGGMRQRAMIAIALSCNPSLLIADEPTTALDATIQAQILDLMRGLQKEIGMAILFITHNLGTVAQMADRVAIMYLGKVVETGTVRDIFHHPHHPYTRDLLRAIPRIGKTRGQRLAAIGGGIPNPFERPSGCAFHPRCKDYIAGRCEASAPAMTQVSDSHSVWCFRLQ
jgi:peptide/nickel transport system ATP-binding protein